MGVNHKGGNHTRGNHRGVHHKRGNHTRGNHKGGNHKGVNHKGCPYWESAPVATSTCLNPTVSPRMVPVSSRSGRRGPSGARYSPT